MKPILKLILAGLLINSSAFASDHLVSKPNILATTHGDLDNDGQPEKVSVFDNGTDAGMGTEREIHIYKKNENTWKLWHKSIGAVMPSSAGGMMGDPFESIQIKNRALVIKHFGGSRDKWEYTHRYRWQDNDWYLIGATIHLVTPCEDSEKFDYNLSTQKATYVKALETCNGKIKKLLKKETLYHLPKTKHKMDTFYPGGNVLKHSRLEQEMYY